MKKTIELSKVLCKDYLERLPLFGKNNKKRSVFWLVIILNFCLVLMTYKILDFLNKIGQPDIFLNIYLLIINIIIMFQVALAAVNIFFYSKDIEYILPYPLKPIEILIAKFNTLLSIAYTFEIMFLFIPLVTYGIISAGSITFFLWIIPVLIVFPLFFTLVISIIAQLVMLLSKFIKNKNIFQVLITFLIVIIITIFELNIFNIAFNQEYMSGQIQIIENVIEENSKNESDKEIEGQEKQEEKITEELKEKLNLGEFKNNLKESNKRVVTLNEIIELLTSKDFINCLINLIKIIFYNLILLILFLLIGNKIYLKNIIRNISIINTQKQKKVETERIKNNKTNSKNVAYIKREIKDLIKNPTYFLQCIVPNLLVIITISILLIVFFPVLNQTFKLTEIITREKIEFNNEFLVAILILIQITFVFSNIALTTITRKGKNASFIKYIPIDFYKQFLLLNIPQFIMNNISIITILIIIKILSGIPIIYILALFVLCNLLNIINSFILLFVDFRRPNLNWDDETLAIKQNKNKIFQYAITVANSIFLIYIFKLVEELKIQLNIFILIIFIIYLIIFLIINILIKKNIKKIFNKIN